MWEELYACLPAVDHVHTALIPGHQFSRTPLQSLFFMARFALPQGDWAVEHGVSGAAFVAARTAELRAWAGPSQEARLLRVLRAYETFDEIDGCGVLAENTPLASSGRSAACQWSALGQGQMCAAASDAAVWWFGLWS
jgi:hypothetical protein